MFLPSAIFPHPPDPALRQPYTTAVFLPLYICHYLLAVLAVLPHTGFLRLAFVPVILWQAWYCAVGLDLSAGLAKSLGRDSSARLNHCNLVFVIGVINIVLKSLEWAFTRKPLRRYDPPAAGQHAPVERQLSISNVLLDAIDLVSSQRGIGWSWSDKPFPRASTRSTSIASILAKMLVKFVVLDASQYLVQHIQPSLNEPAGDTLFDPTLSALPRCARAALFTVCGGLMVYATMDALYHAATLVGRLVLRQQAWQWPPLSDRPWTATSITEFWGFRWHQSLRHVFVVYGARPGRTLLGKPGAILGGFAVSAVIHDMGIWGFGRGTEFGTAGGFFLLMGFGAVLELAFERLTGQRVRGAWGWAWMMAWTIGWGTLMVDAWARRGFFACDFFPNGLRPGKWLVDAIISLV
ncbi:hypothetical protein F5148DRAFT_890301 [Russula earlei]|uniref:Uncharacterized protein n=1 Tax=Russula earlei TaxID=71964 RepID=A0ACC0TRT9_9AGAM|nr:hypothetical protein F5148DRAFT_890301 [Russula earlei]